MRLIRSGVAALAIALGTIALGAASDAANASVTIQSFTFMPGNVTVRAGDTVTWTNRDAAPHYPLFNDGRKTATLQQGQSGAITFAGAGTFPYICGIHGASMSGTVVVQGAAPPPTPPPPPPTQPPTPPSTVPPRTQPPTPESTVTPTESPTPSPTPSPTESPTPSASPSPTAAAVVAAAPTQIAQATTLTARDTGVSFAPLAALAVLGAAALLAFGAFLIRRR